MARVCVFLNAVAMRFSDIDFIVVISASLTHHGSVFCPVLAEQTFLVIEKIISSAHFASLQSKLYFYAISFHN